MVGTDIWGQRHLSMKYIILDEDRVYFIVLSSYRSAAIWQSEVRRNTCNLGYQVWFLNLTELNSINFLFLINLTVKQSDFTQYKCNLYKNHSLGETGYAEYTFWKYSE